ncbi:VOC family protein [Paenibacillus spongiae]|uniref:VOC family protein n=1 Tax=Paenibacillus spongiae TaxID=2909671 RepID=A0ABY5S910_9BACL|nr:VOC family protein [Paenibacillus spongiae]UVI30214.1 VOC family protein [Paenibacillus spongiae]
MSIHKTESELFAARIAPWYSVYNAAAAADFYKAAFDAAELYRLEEDNGKLAVAHLSIKGADFWIQDDPDCSPERVGSGTVRMILTVDDPDALFEQALAAGAAEIAPISEGHGWRIGRIADPFGYHWEIGNPLR